MHYSGWSTYDHDGYAFIAVVGTLVAVVAVQWLIQASRWTPWVRSLQGVAPPFINVIGVLFGLTLAFLANDTWSAHDRAIQAVYKEGDSLRSMATLSRTLPEPMRGQLRQALVGYASASVNEWPLLAQRQESQDVVVRADELLTLLASHEMATAAGNNVQALMLTQASDVRVERDQRIALSQTHVNPLKWLGMGFLGLITLLSVAVVHVAHPRAALVSLTLFAMAAAPTAAIVLIHGNPFQQPAAVTPGPIEVVISQLQGR